MGRKWSPSSKLFAALAALFGLAAFLVVHGLAARVQALGPGSGRTVPVVVAKEDLVRGTELSAAMVRVERFPSSFAPPGAIARASAAAGRTLLAGIEAGEPLTGSRLAPRGSGPVASLVPPGFQAFPVQAALPPGSIRPGDHVQVMATFAGGHSHTEVVAADVEVMLVLSGGRGPSSFPDADDVGGAEQTLFLLVAPEDAERLAYARAFADLSLSIRGATYDAASDEGGDVS